MIAEAVFFNFMINIWGNFKNPIVFKNPSPKGIFTHGINVMFLYCTVGEQYLTKNLL